MKKLFFVVLFLIAGCGGPPGPPTIDTSSEEQIKKTMTTVLESVQGNERDQLDFAMWLIVHSCYDWVEGQAYITSKEFLAAIDGKTAEEIIAIGKAKIEWQQPDSEQKIK